MQTPHDKELFNILFTHNMLQHLNIVERLNPNKISARQSHFDPPATIQTKLNTLASTTKLNKKPTQEYNNYISDENTWGEKTLTHVYQNLSKHGKQQHAGTVLTFLDYMLDLADISIDGRKIFYANLKHSPKTFTLINKILQKTIHEHTKNDLKTLTRNVKNHSCDCVNKTLQRAKKKYSTKAEALKHAQLSGEKKNIILGIYPCVSRNNKTVWHLTNLTQETETPT